MIVADRLSALAAKGEVTERYYNPGNLFDEVHLLLCNDDRPEVDRISPMAGDADLFIHNLPEDDSLFKRSLLWRPRLLQGWARPAVALSDEIRPALIRCHGAHLNGFVASEIKRAHGTPYVVSMHINPDSDIRANARREAGTGWRERLPLWASRSIERRTIANADCVVCVYRFIEPYALRMGARRVETIYNVVCPDGVRRKTRYAIDGTPRLVVPGRQIPPKDPTPVLDAIADIDNVELTLIGDGSLHADLRAHAVRRSLDDRCRFLRAVDNRALCAELCEYDILISVNEYGGVSKVELEAALVGMPTITNAHPDEQAPEVLDANCVVVAGDANSYRVAIDTLLGDGDLRERLGTQLRASAEKVAPDRMEAEYVALYRELAEI